MDMLRCIKKKNSGFSLIELLVATAILGSISIVGVQLLWDTLSTRSKQYSIEGSSDNFRLVITNVTKAIQSAKSVSIPNSSTIEITGTPCRTIKLNADNQAIEQAIDDSPSCMPPDSGFLPITKEEIDVQTIDFSPIGDLVEVVTIKFEGTYKDSLGEHPIYFNTSAAPRVTL